MRVGPGGSGPRREARLCARMSLRTLTAGLSSAYGGGEATRGIASRSRHRWGVARPSWRRETLALTRSPIELRSHTICAAAPVMPLHGQGARRSFLEANQL